MRAPHQENEPAAQLREQLDESEASRRHLARHLDTANRELADLAEREEVAALPSPSTTVCAGRQPHCYVACKTWK